MKNLFSDLNKEQIARLLKEVVTSGNGKFQVELDDCIFKCDIKGNFNLLQIVSIYDKVIKEKSDK